MSDVDFDRLALTDAVRARCIEAHHRYCERRGKILQQPCRYESGWQDEDAWESENTGIFVLRNANGVMERYRVVGDESGDFTIKRLKSRVRDRD
jgi:hypothetical protein